jgi:uncharacterized protein (DUF1919 family)
MPKKKICIAMLYMSMKKKERERERKKEKKENTPYKGSLVISHLTGKGLSF